MVFAAGGVIGGTMLLLEMVLAKVTNKKQRDKEAIRVKRKTAKHITVRKGGVFLVFFQHHSESENQFWTDFRVQFRMDFMVKS